MTDKPVNEIIAEMRMGLEGVTRGPWEPKSAITKTDGQYDCTISAMFDDGRYCIVETFGRVSENNTQNSYAMGHHIARCNPDNIKAILDSHDVLIEALELIAERVAFDDAPSELVSRINIAEQTLKTAKGTGE